MSVSSESESHLNFDLLHVARALQLLPQVQRLVGVHEVVGNGVAEAAALVGLSLAVYGFTDQLRSAADAQTGCASTRRATPAMSGMCLGRDFRVSLDTAL